MDLLLKVVDGPPDGGWRGLEARFDASGGLIGRAETARLSLPDSSRTVSRFHAHVSCSGDQFFLEDMGSRNAATINGKALTSGNKELLRPGDRVRIGRFVLAVQLDDPDFPATQVIDRPLRLVDVNEDEQHTQVVARDPSWAATPRSNEELLDALREGASVHLDLAGGLRPEFMKTVGQILRALASGMRRLTEQREHLQGEFSPGRSRSRPLRVDPVRAAAEDSRWLASLLKSAENGSSAPYGKVEEMVDDLAARLAAISSAVGSAVEQTEKMLSPQSIEQCLSDSLFLDELFPVRRKARLWDLYRRTHAAARRARKDAKSDAEAAGGVREIFEQAFAQAYEAELSRLRSQRRGCFGREQPAAAAVRPAPAAVSAG